MIRQVKGKPFVIQTPGKQHGMVTSQSHIKELNGAPLDALSLHAVAKDVSKTDSRYLNSFASNKRVLVLAVKTYNAWI